MIVATRLPGYQATTLLPTRVITKWPVATQCAALWQSQDYPVLPRGFPTTTPAATFVATPRGYPPWLLRGYPPWLLRGYPPWLPRG